MRLFVYGSLLAGESNASWLGGARFLGSAQTRAEYTLVDLGPYPALLRGGTTSVAGELYAVESPLLEALDAFEGHPEDFQRSPVRLASDDDPAEAYFFPRDRAAGAPVIEGGDWRIRSTTRVNT
jgi:gamma-glutamylcyclotransferase (GGCT)/AIG2-like uncharacterized protein YtfP